MLSNIKLFLSTVPALAKHQRGASMVEYVLIIAVIALAVFVGAQFGLVSAIQSVFSTASTELQQ